MSIRRLFNALTLFLLCLTVCAQARAQGDNRARAAAEIESLREQIRAREAVLLAPSDEDRKAHAEFLARPDTGLVRLLPREKWDNKLSMRGGGAYYSFTLRTNEYGHSTDIGLEQGQFQVGFGGADFGFMTELGDVPLEAVSTQAEAVRFMAGFEAPSAEAEARRAGRQFYPAHREGEWSYTRRLLAAPGRTYAVRSIVYGESDVLVAFRVVRKDDDGSVVLLWKLLEKYRTPSLQRSAAAAPGQ
ncbi:MAG TPA: hypothetical protein VF591_28640 [Pyrinomonadaceae bacterium]|jgi:hypothetical protein